MTKAIGYVRCSTDRQDLSLEQQRQKLELFAKSKGWEIVEVFEDDAISGSELDRPGLQGLLEFAERSKDIQAVLAWDRNRLARPKDPVDGLMLERRLMARGKRVVYAATGQEADRSFASGLIGYVEHYQNGDYLRKLSRDTMRGLVDRAQRGFWTGGPIPFGYDRIVVDEGGKPRRIVRDMPDRSQIVLDYKTGEVIERINGGRRYGKQEHEFCALVPSEPARVKAVQRMFAEYSAGVPIRRIRDELNRTGLRTGRNRVFTAQTIHHILENTAYIGDCVYNRRTESKWHRMTDGRSVERQDEGLEYRPESDWIIKQDAWPALVGKEIFEQVQIRRKASKQASVRLNGDKIHSEYLLTGIFFCGVCGGKLSGFTTRSGKGYRTRYYMCVTHHKGDIAACPKRYTVPAALVEDHIIALIRADLEKLRDDGKLHEYVAAETRRVREIAGDSGVLLQRRLADLDQQAAKMREHLKALDHDSAETLGLYSEAKRISDERRQVEKELSKVSPALPDLPPADELKARVSAAFDRLGEILSAGTIEEKRELIGLYVQKIEADPDLSTVRISLYPALFNAIIAGACSLPLHAMREAFWAKFGEAA